MISFRRAALLGLNAPLSAIMQAVLGLWPEAEEQPVQPVQQPGSGGIDRPRGEAYRPPKQYDWDEEREQRLRAEREESDMRALVLGIIFSGALDG